MRRFLALLLFLCLLVAYCLLLSLVFERPILFSVALPFSPVGFLVEFIGLVASVYLVFRFCKRYGLYNTLSFFAPLFLAGILLEGDWLVNQRYTFRRLNFYFWDTPMAIIFYWSGAYLLYGLYKYLGKGWLNRIKGVIIHLSVDVLITTPLGIISGFWLFSNTLLNNYPYIVPAVHLGEVSFGLFFVLLQERLISAIKINEKLRPIISLTVVFCFLLLYAVAGGYLD